MCVNVHCAKPNDSTRLAFYFNFIGMLLVVLRCSPPLTSRVGLKLQKSLNDFCNVLCNNHLFDSTVLDLMRKGFQCI